MSIRTVLLIFIRKIYLIASDNGERYLLTMSVKVTHQPLASRGRLAPAPSSLNIGVLYMGFLAFLLTAQALVMIVDSKSFNSRDIGVANGHSGGKGSIKILRHVILDVIQNYSATAHANSKRKQQHARCLCCSRRSERKDG